MLKNENNLVKRIIVYFIGLTILCFGIVLNTKTNLGVAAINVIPFVLTNTIGISLGTSVCLLYIIFIVLQCFIKRKVKIMILLQLPVSLLFGKMVDFINIYVLTFSADSLVIGLIMLIIAINVVAIGTTLIIEQNIIPNASDGFVNALADKFNCSFGKAKVCIDVICVVLASIVSMILAGSIIGINIGTIISMVLTGTLCSKYKKIIYQ